MEVKALSRGVNEIIKENEAYWLVDTIKSYQCESMFINDQMLSEIQFWTLKIHEDCSAELICERDSNDQVISQNIEYTDFPSDSGNIKFYLVDNILILPEEY